jgi:ectoine hydroxylase-related dioxygenase (phytanoyl-CoA dioxygenase family)
MDGLVFWSPLVPVTPELGPLQVAVASHRDGLAPLTSKDPDHPEKTGAYALRIHREAELVARYRVIEPVLDPGDLLVIDYLNVHASGFNRSTRSRWSMQMRYFNFREPQGQRMAWAGSFAAGRSIREFHPELMVD